jgi:hypothetical protein
MAASTMPVAILRDARKGALLTMTAGAKPLQIPDVIVSA